MLRYFKPDAYYRSLADVDFDACYAAGYRVVLLDLDNTLIRHGQKQLTAFSESQIRRMQKAGLRCAILSNGMAYRVEPFAKAHGIEFIAQAGKPSSRGVLRAAEKYQTPVSQILLIGDQIFTDVLCGRRSGTGTILVAPLTNYEKWYIRLKRLFERIIKRDLKMSPRPRRHRRKLVRPMLSGLMAKTRAATAAYTAKHSRSTRARRFALAPAGVTLRHLAVLPFTRKEGRIGRGSPGPAHNGRERS